MLTVAAAFVVFYIPFSTAAATTTKTDSAIRYPGPVHYAFDDRVHESCKDLTFCTIKPADYPEEKFNKMFKDYKSLPQPTLIEELQPDDNRQGHPNEENDCQSIVTVSGQCLTEPDGACFTNFPQSPEFVTYCKQKVTTWEILVAKGDNDTEKIKAELPICCSCHYRTVDFANRFGIPGNKIKN
ncbi:jg16224 [Pararge aegeria aegeria]|uniref:Jg16224 protein n=1 Tax=Pararge aegeria aegeria TaxID=348720 RepID=A0A8S4RUT1_9NEOP|nr:jg16224 [Pararge aegeria aegeria]